MRTLGMTHAICPVCRAIVPAKIAIDGERVAFRTFCVAHGEGTAFVSPDEAAYRDALRYVKPAWRPEAFGGDDSAPCPTGCGFCRRHEQHLCMPIVEITNRCDLVCPVCINASGGDGAAPRDLRVDEFATMLDRLIRAERQIDVLNLSGGEPLLHPQLLALVDEARRRPEIVRVSISTNGLALLRTPRLLDDLRVRDVVISLQFDGFDERAYELLRGRPLLAEKLRILGRLAAADATTSLVMTAACGVNETQFRPVLDFVFGSRNVVSLMVQPVAFAGRAAAFAGTMERLTIPAVTALLGAAGHPAVRAEDFVPLPCSHPLCFSLAFYLVVEGGAGAVSLTRLTDARTLLDALANRVVFGLDAAELDRLKQLVYDLWSGPAGAVPESPTVLAALRGLMRELGGRTCACGFDPRAVFTTVERKVTSIFIHAFQDAGVFDLARVRRCCQAYPQVDGRILPACVRNVLGARPGPEAPVHA